MSKRDRGSSGATQLRTVTTASDAPRFMIQVRGVSVRVTRLGFDDEGNPVIELADTPEGVREVFPTDHGYDGEDGMVNMEIREYDEEAEEWSDVNWKSVGKLERAQLLVGGSVDAELSDPPKGV